MSGNVANGATPTIPRYFPAWSWQPCGCPLISPRSVPPPPGHRAGGDLKRMEGDLQKVNQSVSTEMVALKQKGE